MLDRKAFLKNLDEIKIVHKRKAHEELDQLLTIAQDTMLEKASKGENLLVLDVSGYSVISVQQAVDWFTKHCSYGFTAIYEPCDRDGSSTLRIMDF